MKTAETNASDLGRRASLRTSINSAIQPGGGDEYDVEAMGIADGFRPAEVAQNHPSDTPTSSQLPSTTGQALQSQPPRPSSIAKEHRPHESLTLRNDGSVMAASDAGLARASSVSTTTPSIRPESPYVGPTGPSHPYQMYQQNVRLARTPSLATSVTAPVSERSYNGPHRPLHPYQMYPQNTVPAVDDSSRAAPAPVPVGFPGTVDNYQRRLGPEGEDVADMIGPDGHTEQLPPYTRYPEEVYTRKALGIQGPVTQSAQDIPGAGGIGRATRNPEFDSNADLSLRGAGENAPQSRSSTRSFETESEHGINRAALAVTDEKRPRKKWQEKALKRVCGVVPCWALCMSISILVMLAVVLGTVLGIFLNRPKHPQQGSANATSATITWDATPLTTSPANLQAMATGTWSLPLMVNSEPNTCFNNTQQAKAWNCYMVFAQLELVIDPLPGEKSTSDYQANIQYNKSNTLDSYIYSYGMQPPDISGPQRLHLVTDGSEADRGPAWAFELLYNKTVIIPESFFPSGSSGSSKLRRDGGGDIQRKSTAQPGDKPWICHWNNTVLELFIYSQQNSSYALFTSAVTSTTPTTSTTSTSTTPSASTNTAPWMEDATDHPGDGHGGTYEAVTTTTTTSSSTTSASSTNYFDTGSPSPTLLPGYPRVVKMEERRLPGSPSVQAYCQQYRIEAEGQPAVPLQDSNGNFIIQTIAEEEPAYGNSARSLARRYSWALDARDSGSDMSNCGCLWFAT